jgi:hypothetical protein
MNNAVRQYVARFRALGLDGRPATEPEVGQLEQASGFRLPASYKAYLLIAGHEPPSAWVGSDCTLGDLPGLRRGADELLRENGQPPLPANAFVFLMHQGYQFFYFEADGMNDDPPVFYYLEGEQVVVRRFERFSELVSVCAADSEAA